MLAHDGSNRTFPEIDVHSGHHQLSHHRSDPQTLESIAQDRPLLRRTARLLPDQDCATPGRRRGSSLLDHSMIVYGGGIADGNRHNHDDLPLLLAGRRQRHPQARPRDRGPAGHPDDQSLPLPARPHGRQSAPYRRLDRRLRKGLTGMAR